MVEGKDGVFREAASELRHSVPCGPEMGVGYMWVPGLRQLDWSQVLSVYAHLPWELQGLEGNGEKAGEGSWPPPPWHPSV